MKKEAFGLLLYRLYYFTNQKIHSLMIKSNSYIFLRILFGFWFFLDIFVSEVMRNCNKKP